LGGQKRGFGRHWKGGDTCIDPLKTREIVRSLINEKGFTGSPFCNYSREGCK